MRNSSQGIGKVGREVKELVVFEPTKSFASKAAFFRIRQFRICHQL